MKLLLANALVRNCVRKLKVRLSDFLIRNYTNFVHIFAELNTGCIYLKT